MKTKRLTTSLRLMITMLGREYRIVRNVNGSETYDLLGRQQPDGLSHGLNIIKESYANGRTAHKVYMR